MPNSPTFVVIQNGAFIEIHQDGELTHQLYLQEAAELAALLTKGCELYVEQYEDDAADRAAEMAYEQDLEDARVGRREADLEVGYDEQKYAYAPVSQDERDFVEGKI
jgi:hypothetical protein